MKMNIVSQEDYKYYAEQSAGNLNLIIAGMTALMNDTDNRVSAMESQGWFKRMIKTVIGSNKVTKVEIQKNYEKLNAYMAEAISELVNQNMLDREIMMSLGTQLNEIYAEHLQLKQMLGQFVNKLNQKIESIDNFHIINTEIEQGVFSGDNNILNMCKIVSQIDYRSISDERKMEILERSMVIQGILSNNQISLMEFLSEVVNIDMEDIGLIYMEVSGLQQSFIARLMTKVFESYHFLSDFEKQFKDKKSIVESIIKNENLNEDICLSFKDIYNNLIENKKESLCSAVVKIEQIVKSEEKKSTKETQQLERAVNLFLNYDLEQAFEYFKVLSEKGNSRAMYFMGEYYYHGFTPVKEDKDIARKWREKGKDAKDILCSINTAYSYSRDTKEREYIFETYFDELEELALNGDVFALNELSDLYRNGYGCIKDEDKAIEYLEKSSSYWRSAEKLSNDYCRKGKCEKAINLFNQTANLGIAQGQENLGLCLQCDKNVHKNEKEGFRWIEKASSQNLASAHNYLGLCLLNGKGTSENYTSAANHFEAAAKLGSVYALYNLGWTWENFIPACYRSKTKAVLWYKKAAEHGHVKAMIKLGDINYDDSIGGKKNEFLMSAIEWYKKGLTIESYNSEILYKLVKVDRINAPKWYSILYENDSENVDLIYNIAEEYWFRWDVPYDENNKIEAVRWYKKAAELGHGKALQFFKEERYQEIIKKAGF